MKSCLGFELEYSVKNNDLRSFPAIIVAAGSASRMKGIDKLSALLGGVPVLVKTIKQFEKSEFISEIVIVTQREKIDRYHAYLKDFAIKKPCSVVEGSSSREGSVYCGISFLKNKSDKVIIHDGARPLITQDVIKRVASALVLCDSVTCGVKVKDTVKAVNEDMQAVKTLNRDSLRSIQTPQGVNIDMFIKSADENDLALFTDDTSVVEAVGAKTVIVDGDYKNIKITTPEDLLLAEAYLSGFGGSICE